ncbi:hypothetical protein [Pseudomonas sp. R76]|nr:hypothetical protein [Pseudomonas sp. R76]
MNKKNTLILSTANLSPNFENLIPPHYRFLRSKENDMQKLSKKRNKK